MLEGYDGWKETAVVNPVQLQKHLGGVNYPARKDDLVAHAREQGADDEVLDTLKNLPGDRFESPADVSEAAGKVE